MSVFKPRTRIVSFRLSEEEYKDVTGVAIAHGARSVSDFARFAAQAWSRIDSGSETAALRATVRELKGKVNHLDSEVKRLADLVYNGSVAH